MNNHTLLIIILCAALPLLGTAASADSTGTLSGQVRDTHGKPVAGARVKIIETREVTTTNSNGNYTFEGEDPGAYTFAVNSDKHKPDALKATIKPNVTEKLDFILETDNSHRVVTVNPPKTSTETVKRSASQNQHIQPNPFPAPPQETFQGDSGLHATMHSR